MSWDTHWRNSGFFWAYIVFNACMVFVAFYLTRVSTFSLAGLFAKSGKKSAKKEQADQTKGASVQPFPLGATGAGPSAGEKATTAA